MGLIKLVFTLFIVLSVIFVCYVQYKGFEAILEEMSEGEDDCFFNYSQIGIGLNFTNYICDKWDNRSFFRVGDGEGDS